MLNTKVKCALPCYRENMGERRELGGGGNCSTRASNKYPGNSLKELIRFFKQRIDDPRTGTREYWTSMAYIKCHWFGKSVIVPHLCSAFQGLDWSVQRQNHLMGTNPTWKRNILLATCLATLLRNTKMHRAVAPRGDDTLMVNVAKLWNLSYNHCETFK